MSAARATFRVGHWTDLDAKTGCTVVLFDRLVPAVVDVRGGAPGTRETDLLAADKMVGTVDAILFAGGSAHGLAAADGVMQYLRDRARGFSTAAGPVPIVSAAVIFDLAVGKVAWPTTQSGFAACEAGGDLESSGSGHIGAGTGATIAKIYPTAQSRPGGYGWSTVRLNDDLRVHAVVVVNAVGEVVGDDWVDQREILLANSRPLDERSATTLAAIIVDGDVDARTLRRATIAAHDGMARAIVPCHTLWDGDIVYAAQTGHTSPVDAGDSMKIAIAAELAIERAIHSAVSH